MIPRRLRGLRYSRHLLLLRYTTIRATRLFIFLFFRVTRSVVAGTTETSASVRLRREIVAVPRQLHYRVVLSFYLSFFFFAGRIRREMAVRCCVALEVAGATPPTKPQFQLCTCTAITEGNGSI